MPKKSTIAEQEHLIQVLKFTPRTYKISMWGYGGEKVMGTVDRKVWDYCVANQVDLQDIAWSDEDTVVDDMKLDPEQLPFPPGSWYECDGMAHVNGVSRNAGTLQIEDENGNTVFEKSLDDCDGCEDSPQWSCQEEVWVGMRDKGEVVFIGSSNEKGTFFEGEIELTSPFDIEKLELHYDEIDGEEIVNGVVYDGVDIDNWGGSTDGKSSDFGMYLLTDNEGNFERYDPGEKDWGHPPTGYSPSTWESSPKLKFADVKPTLPGYYSVNWGYGSTYGTLYWNGTDFGEWEYGKFDPINQEGIVTWSGYNWDTSDWANQPPEPPSHVCKKCKWTGTRDQLREDEDYRDHCPSCDSTKLDYIDYDPDTKKGQKNRKQYCKPATALAHFHPNVLKQAMDELAAEHGTPTYDEVDALEQMECVQCDWRGSVDETYDVEGQMVCPACREPVEFVNVDEMDIEDALEELKQEFELLMVQEEEQQHLERQFDEIIAKKQKQKE